MLEMIAFCGVDYVCPVCEVKLRDIEKRFKNRLDELRKDR